MLCVEEEPLLDNDQIDSWRFYNIGRAEYKAARDKMASDQKIMFYPPIIAGNTLLNAEFNNRVTDIIYCQCSSTHGAENIWSRTTSLFRGGRLLCRCETYGGQQKRAQDGESASKTSI